MKGIDKSFFMLKRSDWGEDIAFALLPCVPYAKEKVIRPFDKGTDKRNTDMDLINKALQTRDWDRIKDLKHLTENYKTKEALEDIAKSKYKKEEYYAKLL